MRLIDADRLLDLLNDNQAQHDNELKGTYYDGVSNGLEVAIVCVKYAPTIEERKHGHWITEQLLEGRRSKCSVCGECALCTSLNFEGKSNEKLTNYCPHCGAVMDEEVKQ